MDASKQTEAWTAKATDKSEAALIIGRFDMSIHPMLQGVQAAWTNKKSDFSYELAGQDLITYYKAINNVPDYPIRIEMDSLPPKQFHTDFFFPEGCLFAYTTEPIPIQSAQIFKRFASVFGQTYRRYLD